ncbi:MAG: sulfurtransferase TusA family protein [Oscillospiraceae bacterium]|nr:sulfurtransferase TusA family protein [Oscillospiraceae bacterium]
MKTIDARGLSCPQPVLMTKKAADTGLDEIVVLVDNPTAKGNVSRFAANAGYEVFDVENDGEYTLTLKK